VASARLVTRWVVSNRQCAAAAPSGGSISCASTRVRLTSGGRPAACAAGRFGRAILTGQARNPSTACRRRQRDRQAAQLGQALGAGKQPATIGQHTILPDPDQQLHTGRLAGELLIDVALAIGDHGEAGRPGRQQRARLLGRGQPTPALLLRERPRLALRLRSAAAAKQLGMDQPQQGAILRINGDRRVQHQALLVAVIAQARRVLDRQNVPARHQLGRARRRCLHHLGRGYPLVAQKPRDPHLAGAIATKRAHPNPRLSHRRQPIEQEQPPFSRRRSPNRPSPIVIATLRDPQ